jgi:hypothetical protein
MLLRLIILYFVTQWRRTKPRLPEERKNSNLMLVRGNDWIVPWTPVVFTDTGLRIAQSDDLPEGIVVPYSTGNAVLTSGIHDYGRYQVPAPNGTWLTQDEVTGAWYWTAIKPDNYYARIFQHYIIKEDNIMGYAIGTRDVSDVREYTGVSATGWASSGPLVGHPVKSDGTSIAPAQASDEVIVGVVRKVTSQDSQSYDSDGNPTTITTYDVTLQVAEGDFACASSIGGNASSGTPLYVQDYGSQPSSIDSCFGTAEPTTGFSHALLTTVDAQTMHYNGHSRPVSL